MSTLGSESAFPVPDVPVGDVSGNWLSHYRETSDGVSTRLYLAAKAMEGLLAGGARTSGLASVAFAVADDMLVALYAPGRLERLSDDLRDLRIAVAAILPQLMTREDAANIVSEFGADEAKLEAACLRVHEVMVRIQAG